MNKQTILGSGGAIGNYLAPELARYTNDIRLVSRNPQNLKGNKYELFPADLNDPISVRKAVDSSSVVYLTVGLEYRAKIWKEQWPRIVHNVVDACAETGARLVFFDNIYMIDPGHIGHITESSPINPSSEKGKVRALLNRMIMEKVEQGKLHAVIARSADFFGPIDRNNLMYEMVFKNLAKGKKAQWFCNAKVKHSFTFVPDAAKGTALLGNTPDAFDQVWNLPTHEGAISGEEWVGLFARAMQTKEQVQVMPKWMLGALGLFVPVLKEFKELAYQYDRDYFFDSGKFNKRFYFTPVTPQVGVQATVDALWTGPRNRQKTAASGR